MSAKTSQDDANVRPRTDFAPPFAIFRGKDAADYAEGGPMATHPLTDTEAAGATALSAEGFLGGSTVKLLYSRPGASLTYAWFKSGFPLPRHSHDVDCVYFIVAGSLKLGSEDLGKGDGFFIGANVPYTYTPGAQGVEVLEFRTADTFDFRMLANNESYWDRAMGNLLAARDAWPNETVPPSGMAIG